MSISVWIAQRGLEVPSKVVGKTSINGKEGIICACKSVICPIKEMNYDKGGLKCSVNKLPTIRAYLDSKAMLV